MSNLTLRSASLVPIVSRALDRPVDAVHDVAAEPLRYEVFNPVSKAVYKVSGLARVDASTFEWSVLLKTCRPVPPDELAKVPGAMRDEYVEMLRWDREASAYSSGLLQTLPAGLEAPRFLGLEEADGTLRIWLELVRESNEQWDVQRYALAARHLGRFNGEYLAGKAIPSYDWLSHGWIRSWSDYWSQRRSDILEDNRIWSDQAVVELFPGSARDDLRRLSTERESWWSALQRFPTTLAHIDAFRANLRSRDHRGVISTVAFDWSYVGVAPLAAEVAQLVVGSLFYHGDRSNPAELTAAALRGYAEGLRDVSYPVDDHELERAYAINAIARWALTLNPLLAVGDPTRQEGIGRARGIPFGQLLGLVAARTRYLCELARPIDLGA